MSCLCAHCSGASVLTTDGGCSRVTVHVLPAIGLFYPSVSSQLLLSENDVSALSTQHFVILPIRTRQRFDTGNVQALVLYTSHSSCLPSLLLIGECRLVESRCFDLSDILFAPRRAWLCAVARVWVRACVRSHAEWFHYSSFQSWILGPSEVVIMWQETTLPEDREQKALRSCV